MSRSQRKLLKLLPLIPLFAMLSACETLGTRTHVDTSCLTFSVISYAIAPKDALGARRTDDTGNQWDTGETIAELDAHNAKYAAICK